MTINPESPNNNPIDVVIAWVDGTDPLLAEKRNSFLNGTSGTKNMRVHPSQFASNNEIRYCVLSIFKFAPFVRNIFIVTDGQDPDIYDDVRTFFPEKINSIRVVDHKEIFDGFEQYLPTFNSISIGNMIWRIKGLSDNFVYFNDDIFLIRDFQPEDWFIDNNPVLRGKWRLPPYRIMLSNYIKTAINVRLYKNPSYQPRFSFYLWQWKTASMVGMKGKYYFHCHTPHTVGKKVIEDYFNNNKSLLEKNISYRFRNSSQFTFIALSNHLQILNGNRQTARLNLGYLHPYYSKRRLQRRLVRCEKDPEIKSVCAQNLDVFSKEERDGILNWMDRLLGLGTHN
jgi:hypothetical protein